MSIEGGPSHIDTFDPKPKLKDLHLQEFTRPATNFVRHPPPPARHRMGQNKKVSQDQLFNSLVAP